MKKQKKKSYDYTLPVIIIIGLFMLTLLLIGAVLPRQMAMERQRTAALAEVAKNAPVAYTGRSHVIAIDQPVENSVSILSSSLYKPGFVVVQKIEKDIPGEIIGISSLLQPGLYSNRILPINEMVVNGEELYISIYTDNGDGIFTMPETTSSKLNPVNPAADIHEPAMSSFYVL